MNDLITSRTFRCLERKATIMGFELFDVLLIGITLSVTNFLVGEVPFRLIVAWGPRNFFSGSPAVWKTRKARELFNSLASLYGGTKKLQCIWGGKK